MLREVEIRNSSPPLSKPHPQQNSGPNLCTASPTMSSILWNNGKNGPNGHYVPFSLPVFLRSCAISSRNNMDSDIPEQPIGEELT